MDPLVIFFGFGVGILIGLTGIGGGSLMTPLLVIFAGYNPSVAIAIYGGHVSIAGNNSILGGTQNGILVQGVFDQTRCSQTTVVPGKS